MRTWFVDSSKTQVCICYSLLRACDCWGMLNRPTVWWAVLHYIIQFIGIQPMPLQWSENILHHRSTSFPFNLQLYLSQSSSSLDVAIGIMLTLNLTANRGHEILKQKKQSIWPASFIPHRNSSLHLLTDKLVTLGGERGLNILFWKFLHLHYRWLQLCKSGPCQCSWRTSSRTANLTVQIIL